MATEVESQTGKSNLSSLRREENLQKLAKEHFDVLIIGGGITGAGIALDAASRGLKVALVEKQDFAAGTSSRSTKLIHGGLRYLAQFDFGLVRDVAKERKVLFQNAPHLVIPEKMLLPFIKGGTYSKILSAIGLWIYDFLGDVKDEEKHIILNADETKQQEPLLEREELKGGGLYTEYRTDDARLVIEVLKTAAEKYGAVCLNYTEVKSFLYDENKVISGATVLELQSNNAIEIKAKKIVNATGPWVDIIRKLDGEVKGKTLHHTKGVHLVVPYQKLPVKQAIYFDALLDRMIFAIPRGETTYLGTTDTNFSAQLEEPGVTVEDVDYIINSVNRIFPTVNLQKEDIISSWSGIRPLIHEEGKDPSDISRKDEVFISEKGLISIAGGKLTGFRRMAEKVTDIVMKDLENSGNKTYKSTLTDTIKIGGGTFENTEEWLSFFDNNLKAATSPGLDEKELARLLHSYGRNINTIIEFAKKLPASPDKFIKAELWYTINFEGVTSISDFFIRRTGMLYFERARIEKLLPVVTKEIVQLLNLDKETIEIQLQQFRKAYENVLSFH